MSIKDIFIHFLIHIVLYSILAAMLYLGILWGKYSNYSLAYTTISLLLIYAAFLPILVLIFS